MTAQVDPFAEPGFDIEEVERLLEALKARGGGG
jgi:hypothetical protein